MIHQEGLILTDDGQPAEGPVTLRFSLYPGDRGGAAAWTEAHAEVTLFEGYYSVLLGSVQPLTPTVVGQNQWLGVAIDDGAELAPRTRLAAVPYALLAHSLAGGTVDASGVRVGGVPVIDGNGRWVGDPAGLRGEPGPVGPAGPQGPAGPAGGDGSPDTPQQVLDKLRSVDGAGSGLDADLLDGLSADRFMRADRDTGTTGSAHVQGQLRAGSGRFDGHVTLGDRDLLNVNQLQFNDPGPDGRIGWAGTNAAVYVAPYDDANAAGPLRLINAADDISLEPLRNVRLRGNQPRLTWESAAGECCYDAINLANRDLTAANALFIADPGPEGRLGWTGSAAAIYVSPFDDANTDGALRLVNDEGISLEPGPGQTVHLRGSQPRLSWAGAGGACCYDALDLADRNMVNANQIVFNDPGPDGRLAWNGAAAAIYVAPFDDANADGALRLINDGGISLEPGPGQAVHLRGTNPQLTWTGAGGDCCNTAIDLANRDLVNANQITINDPGAEGRLAWNGSAASIYVAPFDDANTDGVLRLVNDGGISLEPGAGQTVYLRGTEPKLSWADAGGACCYTALDLANRDLIDANQITIADPGPDGRIAWTGTNAQIYVAPLNDGNGDGYLRLINDKGISLEGDTRVTGKLTVAGKYNFSRDGGTILRYRNPNGVQTTLDMNACAVNSWCCGPNNDLCYLKRAAGTDGELQFKLTGTHSVACTMLHHEDDTPDRSVGGFYFSTDNGNNCKVYNNEPCFNLRRAGQAVNVILANANYHIICF